MKKKFRDFLVEYGTIGLVVYLTSTVMVYVGFWVALQFGWRPSGVAGNAGYWFAAYLTAKATQIPRIAGSVAITPIIAKIYERVTGRGVRKSEPPKPESQSANYGT